MIKYKGLDFPRDLILIVKTFTILCYYSILINFVSVKKIIKNINKNKGSKNKNKTDYEIIMEKIRRICNFFLYRVYRTNRPCLRRSIVLYRWCCGNGVDARIVIGVLKDGDKLKGHGWIIINSIPYMENIDELSKYIVVMEG